MYLKKATISQDSVGRQGQRAEKPEIMAIAVAVDRGKWTQQSTESTIDYDIKWTMLRGEEGYISNNTTINQEDEVAVVYLYLLVLIVIE